MEESEAASMKNIINVSELHVLHLQINCETETLIANRFNRRNINKTFVYQMHVSSLFYRFMLLATKKKENLGTTR